MSAIFVPHQTPDLPLCCLGKGKGSSLFVQSPSEVVELFFAPNGWDCGFAKPMSINEILKVIQNELLRVTFISLLELLDYQFER
jgi:hypothetical protein